MNVSDKIAEWLHEKRITHAFGIIGGGNVTLWDAIARLGKTELICVHQEQAAVMASGSFNRVSGGLKSIALVTTGAGSTNAITGVAAAYMDSTPLIVLSGNEASKHMDARTRTWGVQGYDSCEAVSGFVKTSCRMVLRSQLTPISYLESCYFSALQPRQGPVWVDCPKDIQGALV